MDVAILAPPGRALGEAAGSVAASPDKARSRALRLCSSLTMRWARYCAGQWRLRLSVCPPHRVSPNRACEQLHPSPPFDLDRVYAFLRSGRVIAVRRWLPSRGQTRHRRIVFCCSRRQAATSTRGLHRLGLAGGRARSGPRQTARAPGAHRLDRDQRHAVAIYGSCSSKAARNGELE